MPTQMRHNYASHVAFISEIFVTSKSPGSPVKCRLLRKLFRRVSGRSLG